MPRFVILEHDHPETNAKRSARLRLLHCLVDRQIEDSGHGANLFPYIFSRTDKERIDQRSGMQMGLANKRPHRLRTAQTAQTRGRKVHIF